jgi:hypothetical protein
MNFSSSVIPPPSSAAAMSVPPVPYRAGPRAAMRCVSMCTYELVRKPVRVYTTAVEYVYSDLLRYYSCIIQLYIHIF